MCPASPLRPLSGWGAADGALSPCNAAVGVLDISALAESVAAERRGRFFLPSRSHRNARDDGRVTINARPKIGPQNFGLITERRKATREAHSTGAHHAHN